MTVAHLNWAYLKAPWGDPAVAEFTDNVDRVNAAAARSPGFVARPRIDDAALLDLVRVTDGRLDPARMAATLSVWESPASLRAFVTRTVHGRFLARRGEWFVPQGVPVHVLWPVAAGHVPDLFEAKARMRRLWSDGPSAEAYDLGWSVAAETAAE